jgi:hypothetical protein
MPICICSSVVRPISDGCPALDRDARQLGSGADEGVERQVDARRDDAAFIGALIIHDVERRCRAKVDDDQVAVETRMGGDRVQHPVRADRARFDHVEVNAPIRLPLPRDQRLDTEIFGAEHLQIMQRARHHGADDHRVHVGLGEALQLQQLVQPHGIFVGGAAGIGGDAPAGADGCGTAGPAAVSTKAKTRFVLPASMASSMQPA